MAMTSCPYCGCPLVEGQTICDNCGEAVNNNATPLRSAVNRQAGAAGLPVNRTSEPRNRATEAPDYETDIQHRVVRHPNRTSNSTSPEPRTPNRVQDTPKTNHMTYTNRVLPVQENIPEPFSADAFPEAPAPELHSEPKKPITEKQWRLGVVLIALACLGILVGGTFLFLHLFEFI